MEHEYLAKEIFENEFSKAFMLAPLDPSVRDGDDRSRGRPLGRARTAREGGQNHEPQEFRNERSLNLG